MAQNDQLPGMEESFDPYRVIPWNNPGLCETALTHSSAANELCCPSYERLEFLGDAVIDMLCAHTLYVKNPGWAPGALSMERGALVCQAAHASRAQRLNLGRWLRLGKGAESEGLRKSERVLGDALEALVGAAYMDGFMGSGDPGTGLLKARAMATIIGILPP